MRTIETPGLETFTIAIVVFFVGVGFNRLIRPLGRWNITEAVTGGLVASLVTLILFDGFGLKVAFDLDARDTLLLYFFTGIGLNARSGDLIAGGRALLTLLALTLAFFVVQNLIAAGGATPTAIANMTSVTKAHGAAPKAFIILPLVSAFVIDLANAAAIATSCSSRRSRKEPPSPTAR